MSELIASNSAESTSTEDSTTPTGITGASILLDHVTKRFPGQQQRVGVARALAADPPVLLMDEPFGAVDPITHLRLQDELINIQEKLQKTIVCVTHDVDEAVKLGDWIAIFNEGAQLEQYDTPERILGDPANEFVENFIGSGAGLIEAGRGMGMSSAAVLFRVELPLAVPVMLSGVRTALVLLAGTAALATFVNGGGLGILITTGVNLSLTPVLVIGALLVALLALLIDWVGRVVEHVARPKGL